MASLQTYAPHLMNEWRKVKDDNKKQIMKEAGTEKIVHIVNGKIYYLFY